MSILAASSWAMALTRPAEAGRDAAGDASFARRQAWLREYERATIADRQASTPSSTPASTSQAGSAFIDSAASAAIKPAMPQMLDAVATGMPDAASDISASGLRALPDHHQIAAMREAADIHAASSTSSVPPTGNTGTPTLSLAQGPRLIGQADTAAPLPSALEAEPRADTMPLHEPADVAVTVFSSPQSLALTLRDARLPPDRADTLLRELVATGLPLGVRRVTVTVNGRSSELHLPSERT